MPPRKLSPVTAAGRRDYPGQPLVEVPDPPAWMRPIAREKFLNTAEYLVSLRAITAAELPLVEMYATAYCHYVEAEMILAAAPLTHRAVLNRQGEEASPVALPAAAQSAKALDQLRKLAAALGLAPVERGRLPAAAAGPEDDPVEKMFAEVEAEDRRRAAARLAS